MTCVIIIILLLISSAHLIALEHDVDMTDVSTGISWLTSSSDVIYTLVVTIHAYKSAILLSGK